MNQFVELMKKRRSRYALSAASPLTDEQIVQLVREAVRLTPSAFNSQSACTLVLLGWSHARLWDMVMETLKELVPAEKFAPTEAKINSFKAGYGTILYFEDLSVVRGLQEQFPGYKDNFPVWSVQSNGMLEFAVWTALAEAGLGASLQHYNPVIDARVRRAFNVPEDWKLLAQMPFGVPTEPAGEKTEEPLDKRVKVFH